MTHVTPATDTRPHVLVIGGGFGGLTAARALAGAPVRVTLLDRTNHHTFQPLLYQVAMAGLSPAEIAQPSRAIVHTQENVTVLMAKAERVDLAAHQVRLDGARVRPHSTRNQPNERRSARRRLDLSSRWSNPGNRWSHPGK